MNKNQKEILFVLQTMYPVVHCALHYKTDYELAVAVILSAQCTDVRVNKVTPHLFKKLSSWKTLAELPISELEKDIFSTGFYKNKAKHIHQLAEQVLSRFGGSLPATLKELVTLPGIGRKTGNVLLGELFGISEGVVVDTHVLRISYRLGFASASKNAVVKEKELMKLLPQKEWYGFSHRLILLGRSFCVARKPNCVECPLNAVCPKKGVKIIINDQ